MNCQSGSNFVGSIGIIGGRRPAGVSCVSTVNGMSGRRRGASLNAWSVAAPAALHAAQRRHWGLAVDERARAIRARARLPAQMQWIEPFNQSESLRGRCQAGRAADPVVQRDRARNGRHQFERAAVTRIDEDQARNGIGIAPGEQLGRQASDRCGHQHVRRTDAGTIEEAVQVVGEQARRDRRRAGIAPPHAGAVVSTRPRPPADDGTHGIETRGRSEAAVLEDHRRRSLARADVVQAAAADVGQRARRRKTDRVAGGAAGFRAGGQHRQREPGRGQSEADDDESSSRRLGGSWARRRRLA